MRTQAQHDPGLRCAVWLMALLLAALSAPGQVTDAASENASPLPAANDALASPRDTMRTFLQAMHRLHEDHNPTAVNNVKAALGPHANSDRALETADELWEVIDRLEYIDWDNTELPDRQRVLDERIRSYTYFPAPRFKALVTNLNPIGSIRFEVNDEGNWVFSKETLVNSSRLYKSLEPLPKLTPRADQPPTSLPLRIRWHMPDSLKGTHHEFLTLEYWQWLGLFLIILLGVILDYTVRMILKMVGKRIIRKQNVSEHKQATNTAVRPLGLLTASLLWVLLVPILGIPQGAMVIVLGAARVFATLAAAWAAWRITDLASDVLIEKAKHSKTKLDDVLIPLLRKTIKIFIVVMGLIYGAVSMNIEIMPLIASLGIGGLAFAFAAKDTVENFFGSVAVLLDRPFEVGDWVVVSDVEGTVEEVGFRSTRIRTFYNSQVTIPNSNLVKATVDNFGRRTYRRWKCMIGIQYDTPVDKMQAFVEGIRELIRTHPMTRKDYYNVYFNQFGPSSLDIMLYMFFQVPDWPTELAERERLFIDIVKLARKLGVEFAFPTQTIHMAGKGRLPDAPRDETRPTPPPTGNVPGKPAGDNETRPGSKGPRAYT